MTHQFNHSKPFVLENGAQFNNLKIVYSDYGNPDSDKVLWVCHALSGSSEVLEWWPGLFGKDRLFSPENYRVICANVIGGCYGSTGPSDFDQPLDFPLVTVKDIVAAHLLLAAHLKISTVDVLIGASLGGQQALEWAVTDQGFAKELILIATNAFHSPFGRAFNETQRLALKADDTFGEKSGGKNGLKAARAMAMLSYRSYEDFEQKQSDFHARADDFNAASYVRYQGEKFVNRFDAVSYYALTKAMDSHDIGRSRGDRANVLSKIRSKTLVIGIDSDSLFPLNEQRFIAESVPGGTLAVLSSPHGHDAFLIEYKKLEKIISDFHVEGRRNFQPTTLKSKQVIHN